VADDRMLAVFVDRTTMRHERDYPHPIELVWDAVTTDEHLDAWMLPVSRVERRLGGTCSFSWGGPAEESIEGTVTAFDPPRLVRYTFGDERDYLQFELMPIDSGTRLQFTQSFAPGSGTDAGEDDAYPGSDRPAGDDTPWRPGFVAGFHEMLDQLPLFLDGRWTLDDTVANVDGFADDPAGTDEHQQWIAIYREHIRETCPPLQ
jgi:uncharacterized protein YndB with AHSA1/START domain